MAESQTKIISPAEVNEQIDQYMADTSVHAAGSVHDNGIHTSQNLATGHVYHIPKRGVVNREIDVKGMVDGTLQESRIHTVTFGQGLERAESASTSDDHISYGHSPYGPNGYAGVVRKTEEGKVYGHQFKDPAKIARASELITSLASKRAARIVDSKRRKPHSS